MCPRQPDPRARLQLVEAAARILSTEGRPAVTARRLAHEVGSSTQAVYTHFGGMDDLIAEIWREGFRRFGEALDEPAFTDDTVADWIEQSWSYRRFALQDSHLYRVMFTDGLIALGEGADDEAGTAASTFLSLLRRIERCRDAGRWDVEDLATAGEYLWAVIHGHVVIELTGYFTSVGRDAERTLTESITRTGLGMGDQPALLAASLRTARRRIRRAA